MIHPPFSLALIWILARRLASSGTLPNQMGGIAGERPSRAADSHIPVLASKNVSRWVRRIEFGAGTFR